MCKVINDLLNRELIKQEFRFGDPIFKNIDEGVDMDQPDTQQSDDDASRVLPSWQSVNMWQYFKQIDEEGLDEEDKQAFVTNYDEDEHEGILLTSIDPVQWMEEFERVKKYINKKCKVDSDDDPMAEIQDKVDLIKKTSKSCKEFTDSNAIIIFERVIAEMESSLSFVRR